MQGVSEALDAFAGKWIAAEPELGLALMFMPVSQRSRQLAFACLQREISHAAFTIRDNNVAIAKLNWWYEELQRAATSESRHPLLQALAADCDVAGVPAERWQAWLLAAVAQRDREPAGNLDAMLAGYLPLQRAAAQVEAWLFGALDAGQAAELAACRHALRELATCTSVIDGGHLPLPLDLLARHQLNRQGLRNDSPPRRQALREQAGALAHRFAAIRQRDARLGLVRHAGLAADLHRSLASARADDPSVALSGALQRVTITTTWAIWRSALRHRSARDNVQNT